MIISQANVKILYFRKDLFKYGIQHLIGSSYVAQGTGFGIE